MSANVYAFTGNRLEYSRFKSISSIYRYLFLLTNLLAFARLTTCFYAIITQY